MSNALISFISPIACNLGKKTASRATSWSSAFGAAVLTACCLNPAFAQLLSATPSGLEGMAPRKAPAVQTEAEKKAKREAYKVEAERAQADYDNFRYTDAQREQTIEFIGAAMKVIRGEAEFDSLTRLLPVVRTGIGLKPSTSARFDFDSSFLNKWTGIDVSTIPKRDGSGGFEPVWFQIDFGPEMNIPRERLEKLLQLKVVHGWTMDGGNLVWEMAPLGGLPYFNGGSFLYSPLKQPQGDFDIEVRFTYLNGPDKDPWTATRLSDIQIRRMHLSPEQVKKRND